MPSHNRHTTPTLECIACAWWEAATFKGFQPIWHTREQWKLRILPRPVNDYLLLELSAKNYEPRYYHISRRIHWHPIIGDDTPKLCRVYVELTSKVTWYLFTREAPALLWYISQSRCLFNLRFYQATLFLPRNAVDTIDFVTCERRCR